MSYTTDEILNWLKCNLTEDRYEHSIGTAEYAEKLAKECGIDEKKSYFAGLIHDCAKCLPKPEMMEILNTMRLEEGELENPKTHHAPAGVYIAKKEFNVTDEEILSSIRWHTIGKLDMSTFEKIIFLADKLEERTRPKEYREPIEKLLKEENGIDKALLLCYKCTIKSLVDRGLTICTATVDIYNRLLSDIKKIR